MRKITRRRRHRRQSRTRRKKLSYPRRQRSRHQKSRKGGMLLDTSIASGTHGQIYTVRDNPDLVAKVYTNSPLATTACPCTDIQADCGSVCKYASYEFQLQRHLAAELTDSVIRIPAVRDFTQTGDRCRYFMEYIRPLAGQAHLQQLNLSAADEDRVVPGVGRFVGWRRFDPSACGFAGIDDVVREVGSLFGRLHFGLRVDGYDCELVAGADDRRRGQLWLIDFDKATCFEFAYGGVIRRKLDEATYDTRKIRDASSLARLLFTAMTSMSLLPTDPHLKAVFMAAYAGHVGDGAIERDVLAHVQVLVDDYAI